MILSAVYSDSYSEPSAICKDEKEEKMTKKSK